MKRFVTVCAVIGMVAGLAYVAMASTKSVNAVGFVNLTLERGKLALLRNDFVALEGEPTVADLLGDQLPIGTRVFIYNGVNYDVEQYATVSSSTFPFPIVATNWLPGTNHLDIGMGFFVSVPSSAADPTYPLTLDGEVLNVDSNSLPVGSGLNLLGFSYPVVTAFTNTALALSAEVGDQVYGFNGVNYDKGEFAVVNSPTFPFPVVGTNWQFSGSAPETLSLGEGFFYKKASSGERVWVEVKPYDLNAE